MFGVNLRVRSDPGTVVDVSRFTGTVRNVAFVYHDGTPGLPATDVVSGLSPEAVYPTPWTLLLRGNLSLSSSLGDFSSGTQVGRTSGGTSDYRIGVTGAQIHAYAPTRLRVETSFGLSEEFAGPFDFRALDGVCTGTSCTVVGGADCSPHNGARSPCSEAERSLTGTNWLSDLLLLRTSSGNLGGSYTTEVQQKPLPPTLFCSLCTCIKERDPIGMQNWSQPGIWLIFQFPHYSQGDNTTPSSTPSRF